MSGDSVPFRPGASPFHVRGSVYRGIQTYTKDHFPGGTADLLKLLPDTDLQNFIQQAFSPAGWYDALPIRPITEAMAVAEGHPYFESVRNRSSLLAQRDIKGVYKLLLRAVTPSLAAARLQRISLSYFNFGHAVVRSAGRNRSEGEQTGIPSVLAPWWMAMFDGYASVVLQMAGAHSPQVRFDPPVPQGVRMG